MNIDYKKLADNDSGEPDVNDALETMSLLTEYTYPTTRLSYISIADRVSFSVSKEVSEKVNRAIIDGSIPQWVDDALKNNGIDINNAETSGLLADIGISERSVIALTNLGKKPILVYPNLRLGHLITARDLRTKGEI